MKTTQAIVFFFLFAACGVAPLTPEDFLVRSSCPATCPLGQVCGAQAQCVEAAALTGSVIDECTGEALPARVTIAGQSTCSGDVKFPYFSLKNLVPGGPYTLAVGKLGYRSFVTSRELTPGDNAQPVISLVPSGGCQSMPERTVCVCGDDFCQ